MNKKPSSTIMTRLCWGAFFLVLVFLAFQVIPRALGQRNVNKRSVAAQMQHVAGSIDSSQLPYDVRSGPSSVRAPGVRAQKLIVPDLPASQLPATSSGPTRLPALRILPMPKLPQVVLYDQYDNASVNATSSQDFEAAFDTFDDELADDFVVPGGQSWSVESIDADGVYFNGVGPALSFHVRFYSDSGGLPGALVDSRIGQAYVQGGSTFSITLSPAAPLGAGTYWVSVQARQDLTCCGQWGWTDRTVQSNQGAAWQNPEDGFGFCPEWERKLICIPTAGGPDQVYRLNGTLGVGTPTPTPTATPTCPPVVFTNVTPISIPNSGQASPYPSDIVVSGVETVQKVTVTINSLTHTFPDDLNFLLVGPAGQNAIIWSDRGDGFDVSNIVVTLDDDAAIPLPDSTVITSGTYQPANSGTGDTWPAPAPAPLGGSALSIFNGTDPNGTWSLYLVDDAGGDLGTISGGWTLTITGVCGTPTPTPTPPPTPTATATATPTATSTPTPTPTPTNTPRPTPTPRLRPTAAPRP